MSEIMAVRNQYRLEEWKGLIKGRKESGQSVKAYCAEQGITERTYYYWLHKLRSEAAKQLPVFAEVETRDLRQKAEALHIQYGVVKIELPGNMDAEAVAAILKAVQQNA